MLGKFFNRILHEDEDFAHAKEEKEEKWFKPPPHLLLTIGVFLLALAARLIVLFLLTDPQNSGSGWYGDVYHHWQIAYLSKEVGFKEGFLRLWDFKGLEFYWGLLHPLVLILGFMISGSESILVPRIVSVIFGSLAVSLVFLIVARYFNKKVAFASAMFLTLMPISLFSDTVGMQEPLGLFFLLLGIYLWPLHSFWTGFTWMLAGMVRSEYWLFGLGLLLVAIIRSKNSHRKIAAFTGYFVPLVLYMKYLLDYTGNAIYPIWTAYLATYKGDWFLDVSLNETQQFIQLIAKVVTLVALAALVLVLWRRPKYYLFFILGFANIALIAAMHGFGAYIRGYEHKVLIDRLLAFPYGFMGILLAVTLIYYFPKIIVRVRLTGEVFGSIIFAGILGATQILWIPVYNHYEIAKKPFEEQKTLAKIIASNYTGEGAILLPEGREVLTYSLVYYEGIPGGKLVSQFYDPFFYYKGEDPYSEWETFREEIVDWLEKHDVKLFVLVENLHGHRYEKMFELETGKLFELVYREEPLRIYKVNLDESR